MEEYNASPFISRRPYVPANPQKEDIAKEVAATLEQLPLLKEVVSHLDNRIEATDSVKQAFAIAQQYGISRELALVVMDILRQQLQAERGLIQSRLEKTTKR